MKHIKRFKQFISESSTNIENKNIQIDLDENDKYPEIVDDKDFIGMQAKLAGMTREEWVAHYASPDL